MDYKAIIGLGNPGSQYKRTRHNIGFCIVDELVVRHNGVWKKRDDMEYAEIRLDGSLVLVIKPQTFMNLSGKVMPYLQKKGITSDQILVVHDELEKPFGSVTLKEGGSHKGHNGLKSLIAYCGPDFWRLRFGIGRPDDKIEVADYVLQNFKEPQNKIDDLIDQALALIA
jgi:PTH1 family peptidyl-tRNA hydrolase